MTTAIEQYSSDKDRCWAECPQEIRERAVKFLKQKFTPAQVAEFQGFIDKYGDDWAFQNRFHFSGGMAIRNMLRSEAKVLDESVPSGNLDDIYLQAIECAVDRRPLYPSLQDNYEKTYTVTIGSFSETGTERGGINRTLAADNVRLVHSLSWALDLLDMYDNKLISMGEPAEKVNSETHLAGKSMARTVLRECALPDGETDDRQG